MKKFVSFFGILPWFAALFLSVLVAGCGGSGQAPILGIGSGVATFVPTVTSVAPLPNAVGVPINTKVITAAFSKAMDPSSLSNSSFTLNCPAGTPVNGVVSYVAASNLAILTLPAATNLPANTLCTATVTTGAKDTTGVPLAASFIWTFTTGSTSDNTAPQITATTNANGAVGVAINAKGGATFSESMAPLTMTNVNFAMKETVTNAPVAGTVSYSGVNAVFTPSANLKNSTQYTLTMKGGAGGVTDLAGNPMASDYVWSWTTGTLTDTTAPRVTATINANGAVGVAINTKAGATFSESMAPLTITNVNFAMKETVTNAPVAGTVSYSGVDAVFIPLANLKNSTNYTLTIKGGVGGVTDLAGNPMASDFVWSWTTGALADTTAPTVIVVNPAEGAVNVATTSTVNATFSEAMDSLTINTSSFTVGGVTGTVAFNSASRIATFTPLINLAANTIYTATVTTATKDLAGNALAVNKVWSFTTAAAPIVIAPAINLGAASTFGTFGGSAGMTNTGIQTILNGDIGSIATGTSMVTGFHDSLDIYTETPANKGAVNGKIYTCTNSTTGPTSAGPNAASCAIATQARLDAQAAYLALVAMPPGANPGANLANLTLAPGVYTSPSGSFLIEGGNLTLDAQGNANAVWVFQMATTLTVGGPGAAAPQSIILAGGAQAKNIYWQVGSFATINAAGGGTMVGTIISQNGASFSTAGNVNVVTLQGRVISLGASVTLVDTVINTP